MTLSRVDAMMLKPRRDSFAYFAEHTDFGNMWCYSDGLKLYVRRTHAGYQDIRGDFQIANVSARKPGTGAFTAFLQRWRPKYRFYVENVCTDRFAAYLTRAGFECVDTRNRCYLDKQVPDV